MEKLKKKEQQEEGEDSDITVLSSDSESDIGLKRNLRADFIQQQMYIKCQKYAENIWDSFTHGTVMQRQKEIEEEEEEAKKEKEKK